MKRILLNFLLLPFLFLIFNCSSKDDEEIVNNFENAEYIKSQMVGKWNYWGHNSPGYGWVYSGDVHKWYFQFSNNNNYIAKTDAPSIEEGTYIITPATKTDNPILYLTYKENNVNYTRKIYLKQLENKTATIFESAFDERYIKE